MDYKSLVVRHGRLRNFSPRTIDTYCHCLNLFFKKVNKDPKRVTKKDIEDYLLHLRDRNKSSSTLNVHLSAIKFFYEKILRRRLTITLPFSKRSKKLPIVLTQKEVKILLSNITNEKHNLIISLLYGAGLRVSEITNLRIENLNLEQNLGWVRNGKGRKDRPFILPKTLSERLKIYLREENITTGHIFLGQKSKYSTRSIAEIIKKARKKAKINKKVHPHTLRHSFATHLVENGYDITTVQSLLGHNSLETTMIYVHIAKPKLIQVTSPLDIIKEI